MLFMIDDRSEIMLINYAETYSSFYQWNITKLWGCKYDPITQSNY